jgi:hypothetical protein
MRRKAGHSMMRRAPSTPLSEGLPTRTALISRHEVRRRRPVHPRKPRDRTSKPESQASERHRSRSACSGTQHHRPCRSSDGQKPAGRTMDATDTKARESRSRGCYQAALYNPRRRHSSLGYLSPITFERHYAATALEPGAHQHAVVLAPVKERPASVIASCIASVPAVLDSRSTRRPWQRAGRDEKMLSAEPKDCPKEEDTMQSNQVP